jgi:hypothetical protein
MARLTRLIAFVLMLAVITPAQANWWRNLFGGGASSSQSGVTGLSGVSEEEIARALREALLKGTDKAVANLGRNDGYWGDEGVRIPLPQGMQSATDLVRRVGGGRAVDAFHLRLNRAAEMAVPEAAAVFRSAVTSLSLRDVRDILTGPEDAATRYFDRTTRQELATRFRPIVSQSIESAGVTSAYTSLVRSAGPYANMLGAPDDLEGYVTQRALDGLFTRVAEEEKLLRDDPTARSTELLRRVFGAAD